MDRLRSLQARCPGIAEVRGLGSMAALEMADPATGAPDAEAVRAVQRIALSQGLLLLSCGPYGNVLRFLYPLTIESDRFERALQVLEAALLEVAASPRTRA